MSNKSNLKNIRSINENNIQNYISGLIQSDGGFGLKTSRNKKNNNLYLSPYFHLTLHSKNINIIKDIKDYFDAGYYRIDNKGICTYVCNNIIDLNNKIVVHFDKYPLCPDKYNSYILFKYIVNKLYNKEHIKDKNLKLELLMLGYHMNAKFLKKDLEIFRYLNLSQISFIKSDNWKIILKEQLDLYPSNFKLNIYFIQGLFDGDGNISVYLSKNTKINRIYIRFNFNIVQDFFNIKLLDLIKQYFNCGNIYNITPYYSRYDVKSIKDIKLKILPSILNNNMNIHIYNSNNSIKLYKLYYVYQLIEYLDRNNYNLSDEVIFKNVASYMYDIIHLDSKYLTKSQYIDNLFNKFFKN